MSSSSNKKSYIREQDLQLNCMAAGEDYEEWSNWGSYPNKLLRSDSNSETQRKELEKLSQLIVAGYVRESGETDKMCLYLEGIVAKYFKPLTSAYDILWRYPYRGNETPATTDSDAPEWDDELR